ncbi:Ldh family oxidoreductase [Limibaculum sp. M0105]|uniref:Ldh family oxidoreductase n=1 Tax=Thermohalobaculum xanthum TaxID=2753746 RepID=A0A8J7M3H4_9RHOB|nr:Ldh family oxidoreductase [Thermohalobaculum xanthum]MBK0397600.1 Ldh family oxidoreductase [Thermohalobaculum xanthum]
MSETLSLDAARALLTRAAIGAGARETVARSIANAAVAAEAEGLPTVGVSHFLDYLSSLEAGRIDGQAEPDISRASPVVLRSDAGGGVAHLGFDRVFEELIEVARSFGVAVFAQKAAYTCGQLGYFANRLAERGLVALAATNGPALLAASGTTASVFCTNPIALAAPRGDGTLLIDQSSSQTAFVNIRRAAEAGEPIPEGWALDAEGNPTTDPVAAMAGALLPYGGARGGNMALMVELLAAGLTGANWSLDAPSIIEGNASPMTGLLVVAIAPEATGGAGMAQRLDAWAARVEAMGGHIPGQRRQAVLAKAEAEGITIGAEVLERIRSYTAEST